jgi:Spy/CpxP family protein refolding chaperone
VIRLSILRLLSAILVIFLSAPPLFAQQSYGEFERGMNLTDEQRTQIDGIKGRYMDEWRSLNDESARKRLELRDIDPGRLDQRERAERLQRDLDRIETSRQRIFNRYRGEVSGVLTSEQRERFNRFTVQENRKAVRPSMGSAPLGSPTLQIRPAPPPVRSAPLPGPRYRMHER